MARRVAHSTSCNTGLQFPNPLHLEIESAPPPGVILSSFAFFRGDARPPLPPHPLPLLLGCEPVKLWLGIEAIKRQSSDEHMHSGLAARQSEPARWQRHDSFAASVARTKPIQADSESGSFTQSASDTCPDWAMRFLVSPQAFYASKRNPKWLRLASVLPAETPVQDHSRCAAAL